MDWIRFESSAYWITFTVTFLLVAVWESKSPDRDLRFPTGRRWTIHGLLTLFSAVFRMLVLRLSPVAFALAQEHGRDISALPLWVGIPVTVLLLDLAKYGTHRLFHAIPWLWRIHRVHHSDPDFDVSTGLRFHPLEPLLPLSVEFAAILLLAPPVQGVIAAQLLPCTINFIQHANANLPSSWERGLQRWFVTPRMHRIHHSERIADQQSNFGDLFPWWDRWVGTYRAEAAEAKLVVGLRGYQNEQSVGLAEMLTQPFQASREPHTED
jgi:sterol desaturase/sphingolipid hydroxylase (fatty acid hydroxylase superfamily)